MIVFAFFGILGLAVTSAALDVIVHTRWPEQGWWRRNVAAAEALVYGAMFRPRGRRSAVFGAVIALSVGLFFIVVSGIGIARAL